MQPNGATPNPTTPEQAPKNQHCNRIGLMCGNRELEVGMSPIMEQIQQQVAALIALCEQNGATCYIEIILPPGEKAPDNQTDWAVAYTHEMAKSIVEQIEN